jgi:hypothetical protein
LISDTIYARIATSFAFDYCFVSLMALNEAAQEETITQRHIDQMLHAVSCLTDLEPTALCCIVVVLIIH